MKYNETINYLYNLLPMFQRVGHIAFKKDLTNTRLLCNHLGNPQEKFKSIHIAGTNGKGSTAHTLAAVFQSAGFKTGLYTSPHLKSFTERIRINGMPIGEQQVVDFVASNKAIIESVQPSFFEMTVAMAFHEFSRQKVDIAIIEVGMGGRFDSTNIISPEISIITNISYDHQDFLGDTLPEIAFEKAGIIKPMVPVIISELQAEVAHIFKNKATEVNTKLTFAVEKFKLQNIVYAPVGLTFDVLKNENLLYPHVEFQLPGQYQTKNLPGILCAIDEMVKKGYKIEEANIREGFKKVKELSGLRGRWEVLGTSPLTICDTAHNEEGIKQVIAQIKTIDFKKLHIVFGVVKDKDPSKVLQMMPMEAQYYFTQASIPRAMEAEALKNAAEKYGLKGVWVNDVNEAITLAKNNATEDDLIFIGGSIFVVAEIEGL
ncbi:MAG: bifunctional folylpolyglutamate synthase/dihydrofolate synthase [Bacteroidota bacterium]|nr:bifunctional folylpolyglutamate synthase/dihydrofolate synthase [Bacteroidota bacterium]